MICRAHVKLFRGYNSVACQSHSKQHHRVRSQLFITNTHSPMLSWLRREQAPILDVGSFGRCVSGAWQSEDAEINGPLRALDCVACCVCSVGSLIVCVNGGSCGLVASCILSDAKEHFAREPGLNSPSVSDGRSFCGR